MEPVLVGMFGVREGPRKERKGIMFAAELRQPPSGCVTDEVGFGGAPCSMARSLVTGVAKTLGCQNFHMPESVKDYVPVLAGAELTGKRNFDLFFLNCLRAVLAIAEDVDYPCECLPPNPGCPWRARLWREPPFTPNPQKELLARTEQFR